MPTLTLKLKEKVLGDYQLQEKSTLAIGRGPKNDIVISEPSVSVRHAKIDSVGDRFVLVDLQSKNGTFVDENLVASHWLKHGDAISIGNHQIVFIQYGAKQVPDDDLEKMDTTVMLDTSLHRNMMIKSNPTKSINVVRFWEKGSDRSVDRGQTPAPTPVSTLDDAEAKGYITYLSGGFGSVKLKRKISTIGKHPSSDVVVKGFFVGQTAITITQHSEGFYMTHINGLAKPKLNGRTASQPTMIDDLSIIKIGSAKLQFSIEDPKEREEREEHEEREEREEREELD